MSDKLHAALYSLFITGIFQNKIRYLVKTKTTLGWFNLFSKNN